jgi:hypothetical protein
MFRNAWHMAYLPPGSRNAQCSPRDVVVGKGLRRLQTLQVLCACQSTRFLLLIPPSLRPADRSGEPRAAERAGISMFIPYRPAEMPASFFEDGFCLNPQGAVRSLKG